MSVDGIWRIEEASLEGWKPVGVAFFKSGQYLRGGNHAYTIGRYELDGNQISITATSTRFGSGPPVYGTKSGDIEITLTGEIAADEFVIEATDGRYTTQYRYTRMGDIP